MGIAPWAISVRLYIAHGLICTSILRLTLKSKKKVFKKKPERSCHPQVNVFKFTSFTILLCPDSLTVQLQIVSPLR